MNKYLLVSLITLMSFYSAASNAVFINSVDQGWWNGADNSNNTNVNANTFTGRNGTINGSNLFRSYFVFDLTGVTSAGIGSALTLFNLGYFSTDASETFDIFDVSTNINNLRTSASNGGTFADLGSGSLYGSFTVGAGDATSNVTVNLTAAAIADINANLGGLFAIGISSQTIGGTGNDGIIFRGGPQLLDLPAAVPVPAALWLFGTALIGLVGFSKRRKTV
jgi:hypothetical protein